MNALHMTAAARGVSFGASCLCAFCGESPFDRHSDLSAISEAVLAARRRPDYDCICAGCRSLLEGKPGSQPPPLRMQNVLCVDGAITYPTRGELRVVIVEPPATPFVVSWATSKKKHHVLHAGVSTRDLQRWGSDDGTILIEPEHRALLAAVESLLCFHPRVAVLTGNYSPPAIVSQGAAAWIDLEARVSSYRSQRVLDLLCAIAFKPEKTSRTPNMETAMIDPVDDLTSTLLAHVARASAYRTARGLDFWAGYFRSRIERHNHRPLAERVSRLLDECQCSTTAIDTTEALHQVADLDEAGTVAVENALRGRAALLVAMAFGKVKAEKAARKELNDATY